MASDRQEAAGLWKPRMSLLNLLLLVTVAAMGVALWQVGEEVVPLREENRRLRNEVGRLNIDDPDKIYAVQLISHDPSVASYRIHLPEGRRFRLHQLAGIVPPRAADMDRREWYDSMRLYASSGSIKSGEFAIEVSLVRSEDDPARVTISCSPGGTLGSRYAWLEGSTGSMIRADAASAGREQAEFATEHGLLLMEWVPLFGGKEDPKPQKGFVVWIEERQADGR